MNNKRRKIVVVAGKTGYGKSYFVKSFVFYPARVVIFDVMCEYEHSNFQLFTDFESFKAYMVMKADEPFLRCIVRFAEPEDYDLGLEVCWYTENLLVVLEEVHQYGSSSGCLPIFEKIIRLGRHRSISILGISQRLHDVTPLFRNNSDAIVLFQLTAPNDIEYLRKIDFIGDRADEVPQLVKFERIEFYNK